MGLECGPPPILHSLTDAERMAAQMKVPVVVRPKPGEVFDWWFRTISTLGIYAMFIPYPRPRQVDVDLPNDSEHNSPGIKYRPAPPPAPPAPPAWRNR